MKSNANELFRKFSKNTVNSVGSAWGFLFAATLVISWLVGNIFFQFSSRWEELFNFGTTVITFLMLFIIQHKQNRDANAINIKLDELILASKNARNQVIDAENLPDDELQLHKEHLIKHKRKKFKPNETNKQ